MKVRNLIKAISLAKKFQAPRLLKVASLAAKIKTKNSIKKKK